MLLGTWEEKNQTAGYQVKIMEPSALMLPDGQKNLRVLLRHCEARDGRCARFMNAAGMQELKSKFDPAEAKGADAEHCFADVVGDSVKNAQCPHDGRHPHIHSHFYSVADSKRSKRRLVSVYLFWKLHLGWTFPVTDDMTSHARSQVESCEHGFFAGNGHLKTPPRLCINPCHLQLSRNVRNFGDLLTPLVQLISVLGFMDDPKVCSELEALGFKYSFGFFPMVDSAAASLAFKRLCARLKTLWEEHSTAICRTANSDERCHEEQEGRKRKKLRQKAEVDARNSKALRTESKHVSPQMAQKQVMGMMPFAMYPQNMTIQGGQNAGYPVISTMNMMPQAYFGMPQMYGMQQQQGVQYPAAIPVHPLQYIMMQQQLQQQQQPLPATQVSVSTNKQFYTAPQMIPVSTAPTTIPVSYAVQPLNGTQVRPASLKVQPNMSAQKPTVVHPHVSVIPSQFPKASTAIQINYDKPTKIEQPHIIRGPAMVPTTISN
eukprot:m.24958 g.24958  ORF g.24958 m.24958 type:complete len:489 (+) comp7659_c0_seq2:179-1645(+)